MTIAVYFKLSFLESQLTFFISVLTSPKKVIIFPKIAILDWIFLCLQFTLLNNLLRKLKIKDFYLIGFTLLEITRARKKDKENKSLIPLEIIKAKKEYRESKSLTGLTGFTPLEDCSICYFNLSCYPLTGFT